MKTNWLILSVCLSLFALAVDVRAENNNRLGAGVHYWTSVKDIDVHDVDKHGFSWIASYQYWPSLIGLEADVEWFESGYAGATRDVYEPQAYLLVGRTIYGAVGIGGYFTSSERGKHPFYAFRAGLNLELIPSLYADINANYCFQDWSELNSSDINSDTITLGAVVRLAF